MAKPYSAPVLSKESARGVANGDFDFLLPLAKNLWRTDEVADAIGRSIQYVRQLIESGRLEAHKDSAYGTRESSLVTRRSVLLYLAETATYDPAYFVIRLESAIKKLPTQSLDRLIVTATRLRNTIREEQELPLARPRAAAR